jgi:ectoine hydroxylase
LLSSASFWCFAAESVLSDIAADLVGPDIKFHSGKLNYIHI